MRFAENSGQNGKLHTMMVQRNDVRDPSDRFVERYWQPPDTPLFDQEVHVVFLLHHVEDVTDEVLSKLRSGATNRNG